MLAPESNPGSAGSGASTAGHAFGEYQLHGEIGRDGMGAIYKARHARLNRWVALKVMAGGEFASADFKQRFRTEAEARRRWTIRTSFPSTKSARRTANPTSA